MRGSPEWRPQMLFYPNLTDFGMVSCPLRAINRPNTAFAAGTAFDRSLRACAIRL